MSLNVKCGRTASCYFRARIATDRDSGRKKRSNSNQWLDQSTLWPRDYTNVFPICTTVAIGPIHWNRVVSIFLSESRLSKQSEHQLLPWSQKTPSKASPVQSQTGPWNIFKLGEIVFCSIFFVFCIFIPDQLKDICHCFGTGKNERKGQLYWSSRPEKVIRICLMNIFMSVWNK